MRAVLFPLFALVPFVAAGSLVVAACTGVSELAVGSTPTPADAGGDAASGTGTPDAMLTGTLLDKLEARCALPAGQIDVYTNAAQLSTRLKGRWYHCRSIVNWDLPRGTGLEYTFVPNGSYAFLDYADGSQLFTPSTDVTKSGEVLYQIFGGTQGDGGADGGDAAVQSDAGGSSPMFIPVDDTTTHNGIFAYLTRATDADLQFQMLFEQNPRKLHMNELGDTPVFATFVPID